MNFIINEKFNSYEEVQKKIDDYSKSNYTGLYKRDSRTIKSACNGKRLSLTHVNEEKTQRLRYFELKYACLHGGRQHKSRSKGMRKSSSFRKACPFTICLKLDEKVDNLFVSSVNLEHHNHEIDEDGYNFLPKVRKLSTEQKEYAKNMLSMNVNKKKLQQLLQHDTGKNVLLKDLSNIAVAAKRERYQSRNDLSSCIDILQNKHNCFVEVLFDITKNFVGLFIQDKIMKDTFSSFPEIMFLDATYKLLDLQFPVFVFAVEDSNGQTEIVAIGLLVTEDEQSLRWLINTFKSLNPEVLKTRLVMADKDVNERHIIKKILPHIKLLICHFHALRTFGREITTYKMGIKTCERNLCLQYFLKMLYAKTESDYEALRQQFLNFAPTVIRNYFETSWHPIRDEWVMGPKFTCGNFTNSTNNRLESLYGKLEQVLTKYSSPQEFINQFFVIMPILRNEQSYKAWHSIQKSQVTSFRRNSPETAYRNLLTKYATSFVMEQLNLGNQELYEWQPGLYEQNIQVSDGLIKVTHFSCTCFFFMSMLLPCRHIFSLRLKNGISLFDPTICNARWTNNYYQSVQKKLRIQSTVDEKISVNVLPEKSQKRLNTHQKYSLALAVSKKIANTLSFLNDDEFERKLSQLNQLNEMWIAGKEIGLKDLTSNVVTSETMTGSIQTEEINRKLDNIDFIIPKDKLDIESENVNADVKECVFDLLNQVCFLINHDNDSVDKSNISTSDIKCPPP